MSYINRIKTLEESHRLVQIQIDNLEKSNVIDKDKLSNLVEVRNKYLSELRLLRKLQYEESQVINYDDDR